MTKWLIAGLLIAVVVLLVIVVGAQAQGDGPLSLAPQDLIAANGPNSGEVNLTWTAIPGASSYRVGWLANADYQAYPDKWQEKFRYSDVTANSEYTLTLLVPGIKYYFIVGRKYEGGVAWPQQWATLTLNDDGAACPTAEQTPESESTPTPQPTSVPVTNGDYDADNDGLIEVSNLAQLNAIRYDPDGDGYTDTRDIAEYIDAFPEALDDMGCPPTGCVGYELVSNLDFDTNGNGQADVGDAYWNDGKGWNPIIYLGPSKARGRKPTLYGGIIYTISNLYINRPDQDGVGLFSTNDGIIMSLTLIDVDITGNHRVGSLAGKNQSGWIDFSSASGSVTGDSHVGGLVGYNLERISYSDSSVDVTGNNNVGSLVGYHSVAVYEYEVIDHSTASGIVIGKDNVGGLIGSNAGVVRYSTAAGDVNGRYNVGGLVGLNDYVRGNFVSAVIEDSVASGDVAGTRYLGELVGRNDGGTITNSQGTGTVTQSN